jgi:hypothetical protein
VRSGGVLERKLTDHVNKQLMAAHLRLDLKQIEKPEIGRLYEDVFPNQIKLMSGNGSNAWANRFCDSEQHSTFSIAYLLYWPVYGVNATCFFRCMAFAIS